MWQGIATEDELDELDQPACLIEEVLFISGLEGAATANNWDLKALL